MPAALYVFLYSVHYFFMKTKMTGFFQTAFYFGYTLMFCLGKRQATFSLHTFFGTLSVSDH